MLFMKKCGQNHLYRPVFLKPNESPLRIELETWEYHQSTANSP